MKNIKIFYCLLLTRLFQPKLKRDFSVKFDRISTILDRCKNAVHFWQFRWELESGSDKGSKVKRAAAVWNIRFLFAELRNLSRRQRSRSRNIFEKYCWRRALIRFPPRRAQLWSAVWNTTAGGDQRRYAKGSLSRKMAMFLDSCAGKGKT